MIRQLDDAPLITLDVECVLRDGTVLRADVYLPKTDSPVPALLHRTPYDKSQVPGSEYVDIARLVASGYGVVVQDVRGRYRSDGEFSPSANEARDGADAVAWVADLDWCDGSVGMWGASYTAEVQWSAKSEGAPALRAMAPALSPAHSSFDGFRYRGGAREFGSMVGWALAASDDRIARLADAERVEAETAHAAVLAAFTDQTLFRAASWSQIPQGDPMVDWMLRQLAEPHDSDAHDLHKIHAAYDRMDAPAFLIGGWYDVFLGSTLAHHRSLVARAERGEGPAPALLVGPWSHIDQSGRIGDVDYSATGSSKDIGGTGSLTDWHLAWYDSILRSRDENRMPAVFAFDTGTASWCALESFPPAHEVESWYLGERGALTQAVPAAGRTDFVADPIDPVPTIGGPTLLAPPYVAGPFDQRPLYTRDDVVSFRSAPFTEAYPVAGPVAAEIAFSTSGDDADIVVRLCDEHPDGSSIPVADGIVRLSARDIDPDTGRGEIRPVPAGMTASVRVDLWAAMHTFAPGHRARVDVTWSSSPRWDVNRHVVADPFSADYARPATHTVHLGGAQASRIDLPRAIAADPPH
ncbi:CocE/NonD family hydrolase [Microbacterium sp.]|uniref:CocE/NonD family hydrolase n=1 Tax=Microbacterium sp. TaxID=51671 RepID=UPI003A8E087F